MNTHLPIHTVLPALTQALYSSAKVILTAPPGSGKTTVVPLALLSESWLEGKSILLLEPRRLAARMAATYMSGQLEEQIGQTVGYQVRFDAKIGPKTRVEIITGGIFTRRLQKSPELAGVGLVIFDEFHERSLDNDLNLALCLDAMNAFRDDLRLLVMSATLDTGPLAAILGNAPVIKGQGTLYPVTIQHLTPKKNLDSKRFDHIAINTVRGIKQAVTEQQGDILAFLPGTGEIRKCSELLQPLAQQLGLLMLPLYGDLSLKEQARVVQPDPHGKRRVILATTIAESSLTIEGIRTVVDCGWKRTARFDPNYCLTRLETVRISKASAKQRQGRAGRLGPGVYYCLWNLGVGQGFAEFDKPEMLQADLASLVLELAAWGVTDANQLTWLDPLPGISFLQARNLLAELGALDKKFRITALGRKMVHMPVHPRLAGLILKAQQYNSLQTACDIAALLSERDILRAGSVSADIEDRLHGLAVFRKDGKHAADAFGADHNRCRRCDKVSRQLSAVTRKKTNTANCFLSIGALLTFAFPDRIAKRRGETYRGSKNHYKLVSGQGAKLPQHDRLLGSEYIAIAALDAGRKNGRIFLAAALEKAEIESLFSDQFVEENSVSWDENANAVSCVKKTTLGSLVVSETPLADIGPEAIVQVVLDIVRNKGLTVLPWNNQSRSLQARIENLHQWQPEINWPDFSDENLLATLDQWLAPYLPGIRSLKQLSGLHLQKILAGFFDWEQKKMLDAYAPEFIQVPSGSKIRLQYRAGEPPILAVKIQEVFGMSSTPEICQGRVKVMMHLLSPARRPVQITQDIKGFWTGSYNDVKKELKGRYPKHYWPDEPLQAVPTAKLRPGEN